MPNERQTNEAHASVPDPAPARPPRPRQILLVDDDEALAQLGEAMLSRLGYTAVVVTSSPESLAIFQAAPQRFDLLLTDYSMPEITGIELAAACRQGDRKIKRPFPPPASAHSMPPCCHPARRCPRLGSAGTPRASGWPVLDAAGSHRSARTGRVAGDGQSARLELLGGRRG